MIHDVYKGPNYKFIFSTISSTVTIYTRLVGMVILAVSEGTANIPFVSANEKIYNYLREFMLKENKRHCTHFFTTISKIFKE